MENVVDRMLVDLNRTLVVEEPVEDTKPAQSKQASVHYRDTDILSALRVESGGPMLPLRLATMLRVRITRLVS
jgi:hypothetical protein